jgi:tetratricopeptide (TPR) repeat protein
MAQLTAFVARSFDPTVEHKIQPFLKFLSTYKKAGFFWESAEPAEVESVSRKVQRLIKEKDVFIGFFTKRYPVYGFPSKLTGALNVLLGSAKPQTWSTVPWVLQESGYAIAANRHLIFLREEGVEIPSLQGDLEYISFDSANPTLTFPRLNEMINDLLARAAGREVILTVSESLEQTQVPIEQSTAEVEAQDREDESEKPDIVVSFVRMKKAIKDADFSRMYEEWSRGTKLISEGVDVDIDQLVWDCHYYASRFDAGDSNGLDKLRQLRIENPKRREPVQAIATCLSNSKEYEEAARLFLEVARLSGGEAKVNALINAADAFRELKQFEDGKKAAYEALSIATGDLRPKAIAALYQLLLESGDIHFAFATAESALHENPLLPIRFKLGLDYHRYGLNELSLLHFKFLHERSLGDSSPLHNLSLLYSDCKLPISAVDGYKKSFAMGETLSAANLGFLYLDAGMKAEAKLLIEEAIKVEPHERRVDKCLAEIVDRTSTEEAKENELLKGASADREFFIKMGEGLSTLVIPEEGLWQFPFGKIGLTVSDSKLTGVAEIRRNEPFFGGALFREAPPKARIDKYVLEGRLIGAVCQCTLTITENIEAPLSSVSALLGGAKTSSGVIVFASDGRSGRYAEIADRKIRKSENIRKLSGSSGGEAGS